MRRVLANVLAVATAAALLGFTGAMWVQAQQSPAAVQVASWA